jgi:hypothetical protein
MQKKEIYYIMIRGIQRIELRMRKAYISSKVVIQLQVVNSHCKIVAASHNQKHFILWRWVASDISKSRILPLATAYKIPRANVIFILMMSQRSPSCTGNFCVALLQ